MALAQLISSLTAVAAKLLQTEAQENEGIDTGQVCVQNSEGYLQPQADVG